MANQAMETKARDVFRQALALHYIEGIAAGKDVDAWLRSHGGWLPDPQEDYGEPPAPDEGWDATSPNPALAMEEATKVMVRLKGTLVQDGDHEEWILGQVDLWLG
jgi:hypothetical protein